MVGKSKFVCDSSLLYLTYCGDGFKIDFYLLLKARNGKPHFLKTVPICEVGKCDEFFTYLQTNAFAALLHGLDHVMSLTIIGKEVQNQIPRNDM